MKKGASDSHAAPRWPIATRKWAAAGLPPRALPLPIPLRVANTAASREIVLPTVSIGATIKATAEATEEAVTAAPATVPPTAAPAATVVRAGAEFRHNQASRRRADDGSPFLFPSFPTRYISRFDDLVARLRTALADH